MAAIGRSLALRGESVWLISEGDLIPCSDWDLRTRFGQPTAYRLSIPEAGGGVIITALAGEGLHVRIGADVAIPWIGVAPLKRSSLTASMLDALGSALAEVFEFPLLCPQIDPFPQSPPTGS